VLASAIISTTIKSRLSCICPFVPQPAKMATTHDLAGTSPLAAAGLHGRTVRLTDKLRSTALAWGTAKWRFLGPRKAPVSVIFRDFLAVFPVFFAELAHQGANWGEYEPKLAGIPVTFEAWVRGHRRNCR
jgi:hypothetical protein